MKKWFLLAAVVAIGFTSCLKDDTNGGNCNATTPTLTATATETAFLQNYLTANNITNAVNINGMFYVINTQGTGASPGACSFLGVFYEGRFINGTSDGEVFDKTDANSPRFFGLNEVITGWQIPLPTLKTNGTITLYIPPSMAYGATGRGSIPGNSYLKFTINLLSIQ